MRRTENVVADLETRIALEGVSGLYQLKAWLLSLQEDDPDYYCGYELDFGMDRSQVLDKIDELIKEGW